MEPAPPRPTAEQLAADIERLERDQLETSQALARLRAQLGAAYRAPRSAPRLPTLVALGVAVALSYAAMAVFGSHWKLMPEWIRNSSFWELVLLGGLATLDLALPTALATVEVLGHDPRGRWLQVRGWAATGLAIVIAAAFLPLAFFGADAWITALTQLAAEVAFIVTWRLAPAAPAPLPSAPGPEVVAPPATKQRGEPLLWVSASLATAAMSTGFASFADHQLWRALEQQRAEAVGLTLMGLLFTAHFWVPAGLLRAKSALAPTVALAYAVLAVLAVVVVVPGSSLFVLLALASTHSRPLELLIVPAGLFAVAALVCQLVGGVLAWRSRPKR